MADNGQYITRGEFAASMREVGVKLDSFDGKFSSIMEKMDTKTRPNWAAAGVAATVIIALCVAMFYYFNTRIMLAEANAKERWEQVNVRIERSENRLDDDDRDYRIRYRDMIEKQKAE